MRNIEKAIDANGPWIEQPHLPRGARPFIPAKHLGGSGFALSMEEIIAAKKIKDGVSGTYINAPEQLQGTYFVAITDITEEELVAAGLTKESEESTKVRC